MSLFHLLLARPHPGAHHRRAWLLISLCISLATAAPAVAEAPAVGQKGQPQGEQLPVATPIAHPEVLMEAMAHEFEKEPDHKVLVLGNMAITQGEMADVVRTMPPSLANMGFAVVARRALDTLIAQKTFVQMAIRDGVDKDPAFTRRQNVLREKALADIWLGRKADTAVTDKALHDRYQTDVLSQPTPVEVRARVILVPDEDQAARIIAKAQNGDDFPDLARSFSKDATAQQGGDLGYVTMQAVAPEIGHVIFALAPGQVNAFPLKVPSGYVVVRVEGRQQRAQPTFEEARPTLEAAIRADATRATIAEVLSKIRLEKAPEIPHQQ